MAISTTTFAERVATIEKNAPVFENKTQRKKRSLIWTFPFLFGVSILIGGTAYACIEVSKNHSLVLAFAG